jgi:branched-chain amino acid transport system ATP-binding protein
MTASLRCENITVRFGGYVALNCLTAEFMPGKTCAVIGPNGAGKTTLLNALTGIVPLSGGQISMNGNSLNGKRPDQRARLGIGRSFQIIRVFKEMTPRQNLRVAAQRVRYRLQPFWRYAGRDGWVENRVEEILEQTSLTRLADTEAARLSHGNQRGLELGLAIIGNPQVLLLDEPLAGVGQREIQSTVTLLHRICGQRTTILVEHNMEAVYDLADEVIVLVEGGLLLRSDPAGASADPRVRAVYLGN